METREVKWLAEGHIASIDFHLGNLNLVCSLTIIQYCLLLSRG